MALNHLAFQGRFVEDPKFGDTKGGTRYANFRLAWSEKYKEQETRCFLECKAFSGAAQFMEKYMNKKGQEILVEGKLTTEEWENQEGQKRSKLVLVVQNVHFCGKREGSGTETAPAAQAPTTDPSGYEVVDNDSLPF